MKPGDQLYGEWQCGEDAEENDREQNTVCFVSDQFAAKMGQQKTCRNDARQCGNGETPE